MQKNAGAKVILASHLGRPKGGEKVPEMSLGPVAKYITDKFFPCAFAVDCIRDDAKAAIDKLAEGGDVLLLENLRYHKGEEKNFPEFAAELASLADVYVNDAFGTCHRKHASTYGMAEIMSERGGAGFLVEKEIRYFEGGLLKKNLPDLSVLSSAEQKCPTK